MLESLKAQATNIIITANKDKEMEPVSIEIGSKEDSTAPQSLDSSSGEDNDASEGEPPKKKNRRNRQRAKNFPKVVVVDDGNKKSFPFLKQKDPRDYEIFKQLNAMDTPPWLEKGGVTAAWEKIAKTVSSDEIRDHETGKKLFPNGISGKMLKERFDKIASEMKKWIDSAPWRSGNDNEESNQDDFVGLVEEVLSLYYDFCLEKEGKTKAAAAEKEQTAAFAKAMRDAAIGEMTAAEVRAIVSGAGRNGQGAGSAKGSDRSATPSPSPRNNFLGTLDKSFQDHSDQIKLLGETQKLKAEQKLKAHELKREKLQLESQKLKLERDRFEAQQQLDRDRFEAEQRRIEAQERQQSAVLDAQQRQQESQNEIMKQMLEFMKSQFEKNNK